MCLAIRRVPKPKRRSGRILGSFLGAFLSELYYNRKGASQALKAAFGSFLGFITGTGLKAIAACLMMWQIIVYL